MAKAFLESEFEPASPDIAKFYIIPCPLEKTVSYGKGAAKGPAAILEASQELEALESGMSPGKEGFYTAPPVDCSGPMEMALRNIEAAVGKALARGAIPVLLGGEHTVSLGAFRAIHAWQSRRGKNFGVVQFDAHADLRSSYKGENISHATVMARALEEMSIPLVQFAVREISPAEVEVRERHDITHYDAYFLARVGLPQQPLPENFPTDIYISFDLDAFDSSLMPATGTPSPGGINWRETQFILESCAIGHRIIGIDVVELAPIDNLPHANFTAAKLAHLLMGLAVTERENA